MPLPRLALRSLLLMDAATCTAMGGLLVLGAAAVGDLTGLPPALLFYAGLALIPTAAFMALVATRPAVPPAGVWLIIAGNGLWAAASLLLLASGLVTPNALGVAVVIGQALAVALLAKLEHDALRRMPTGGAAVQPAG